ncbi:unnamed protein product [Macrosiphum euphorbiae]|uniref:Uncharacterized protein n=1 Tax=Macrosiphum euphorbiae TaxID=13131 RepID=A0AAV0W367_9HEMI|nr:unnamed protein product [Macrosiphum euphorbiae]
MSRIQSVSSDAFENDSDMDLEPNDDSDFQVKSSKKNEKSKLKRALLLSSSSTSPKTSKKNNRSSLLQKIGLLLSHLLLQLPNSLQTTQLQLNQRHTILKLTKSNKSQHLHLFLSATLKILSSCARTLLI